MIEVLTGTAGHTELLAELVVKAIGNVTECRIVGKKQ
jgi:hypothetical protein